MKIPNKVIGLAREVCKENHRIGRDYDAYGRIDHGQVEIFEDSEGKVIKVDADRFFGRHIFISGISGAGKSNTIKRFLYEYRSRAPVNISIFDPANDYWTMREKFPDWKVVGADQELTQKDARGICEECLMTNTPFVISLLTTPGERWPGFVREYLNTEWDIASKRRASSGQNMPHINVLEECHEFIPQSLAGVKGDTYYDMLKLNSLVSGKFAKQGRRYGTTLMLATQRAQDVSKKVITQCQVLLLHKVVDKADIDRYKETLRCSEREVRRAVSRLRTGQCIVRADFNNDGKLYIYKVRKLDVRDVSKNAKIEDSFILADNLAERRGSDETDSIYHPAETTGTLPESA